MVGSGCGWARVRREIQWGKASKKLSRKVRHSSRGVWGGGRLLLTFTSDSSGGRGG